MTSCFIQSFVVCLSLDPKLKTLTPLCSKRNFMKYFKLVNNFKACTRINDIHVARSRNTWKCVGIELRKISSFSSFCPSSSEGCWDDETGSNELDVWKLKNQLAKCRTNAMFWKKSCTLILWFVELNFFVKSVTVSNRSFRADIWRSAFIGQTQYAEYTTINSRRALHTRDSEAFFFFSHHDLKGFNLSQQIPSSKILQHGWAVRTCR